MEPSYFITPSGDRIAYHQSTGREPGVMFLGGFRSDMTGNKALRVESVSTSLGRACLRFDYHGHGQSEGAFRDGTIGRWAGNALAALDALTDGKQVLVGSSMGGWIMLLLALARPEKVAGLIGIAAAPDFTEDLIWPAMTARQQEEVMTLGETQVPSEFGGSFPITRSFIEEARSHLLLKHAHETLNIICPVRLLHGMQDADVPWTTAPAIADRLASKDVQIHLIKDGDHRLSSEENLEFLESVLKGMLA